MLREVWWSGVELSHRGTEVQRLYRPPPPTTGLPLRTEFSGQWDWLPTQFRLRAFATRSPNERPPCKRLASDSLLAIGFGNFRRSARYVSNMKWRQCQQVASK
jgi:hypothetical protein